MALSIQLPDLPENLTEAQVMQSLIEELGPRFAIYVISFFVISVYWISYHQIFNRIASSHAGILWLNIVFLFFITLIPFAVNLQVDYGFYHTIFILYALVLVAAGLMLTLIWLHAKKNRLIDKNLSNAETHTILIESIITPSVFALSILVSIIDLQIAYYFWILIAPAKIVARKRLKRQI
jgi:TMEM175 potassium channel family protein